MLNNVIKFKQHHLNISHYDYPHQI